MPRGQLLTEVAGKAGAITLLTVLARHRPGRVVGRLILSEAAPRCDSPRISVRPGTSRRTVPASRSQVVFIRGAWTALARILAPRRPVGPGPVSSFA